MRRTSVTVASHHLLTLSSTSRRVPGATDMETNASIMAASSAVVKLSRADAKVGSSFTPAAVLPAPPTCEAEHATWAAAPDAVANCEGTNPTAGVPAGGSTPALGMPSYVYVRNAATRLCDTGTH